MGNSSTVPLDHFLAEMITWEQQGSIPGEDHHWASDSWDWKERILRKVGDLCEVVPSVEMTLSAKREFTFSINTDIRRLYSLCIVPLEWTKLKDLNKTIHTKKTPRKKKRERRKEKNYLKAFGLEMYRLVLDKTLILILSSYVSSGDCKNNFSSIYSSGCRSFNVAVTLTRNITRCYFVRSKKQGSIIW